MKIIILFCIALLAGCSSPQYAKIPTASLQLRHTQCVRFVSAEKNNIDIKVGPPIAMLMMGDGGRADRIKELESIETELLRRWQAGDKEADLPMFHAPSETAAH